MIQLCDVITVKQLLHHVTTVIVNTSLCNYHDRVFTSLCNNHDTVMCCNYCKTATVLLQ